MAGTKGRDYFMVKKEEINIVSPAERFRLELAQKTKEIWEQHPNLVYVIVGINSRQQAAYKSSMEKYKRLETNPAHNEGEVGYISTKIQDEDVMFVIAPNPYKCVKMFYKAPMMVHTYRNGSSFRNHSLDIVYCVDHEGRVCEMGEYALVKVCNCGAIDEKDRKYLLDDIREKLNVMPRESNDKETITFFCRPVYRKTQKSDSRYKTAVDFCKDKTDRLAIALSNCPCVYQLDVRGKEESVMHCAKQYGRYSNEELLQTATMPKGKKAVISR